jgi:hypothetical protein
MADNTVLNPGTGGDTLKTEDCGTGFKIPAGKIYLGAADVNGGPVTPTNPFPTQDQSGSLTGLLVGGVPLSLANPLPVTGSISLSVEAASVMESGSVTAILVGGQVSSQNNPQPVEISAAGVSAGLFSFHNVDNQTLGSTAVGLNVGGVAQLLNVTGNLDRQRETGVDTIPSQGVATSANQLASPFVLTGNSAATGSQLNTVPVTSLSGTSRGAFWAIQVGSTLQING